MAISRFSTSRLTQGLPKYQSAWDQDGVAMGSIEPIASAICNGATNNTFFTNIPQHYQDLMVVANLRSARTGTDRENFNIGLDGLQSIYSHTQLVSDGSSLTSTRGTGQYYSYLGLVPSSTAGSGIFGTAVAHIMNYKNTTTFKTILSKTASDLNGSGQAVLGVGLIRRTAAIDQLFVSTEFTNTFGTITLYGIGAS
jgi:hypothetical protein